MLSLGIGVNGRKNVSLYDANALAFINATGLTGTTEKTAVNNLVKNLKSYGLWSKMKAIYPFVSDTYNLTSYTEDFTNAAWNKIDTSATANTTTAPDGTLTADSLMELATNSRHIGETSLSNASGLTTYTMSAYVKPNGRTACAIVIGVQASTDRIGAYFNLANGTLAYTKTAGSGTVQATSITAAANGFYRVSLSFQISALKNIFPAVVCSDRITDTGTYLELCPQYTGDITKGLYVWGAQLQQGTLTDYQPIATTPANRFVSQFKYNLKDARDLDAAFRLAFNGGWTYSKQGVTPNGVNAYADSYLIPNTSLTLNNTNFGYYSRTNSAQSPTATEMAVGYANGLMYLRTKNSSGNAEGYSYSLNAATVANANSQGWYNVSRITDSSLKLYKNGSSIASVLTTQTGLLPPYKFYISAVNYAGTVGEYSNKQVAFSTIGDGLTDTEATNLYTSVQLFQQELSRYVGVPIVSDANAQAFLDAAVITDQTQANAVNTLVTDLKTYGLWTKMKAIYPFVGGTATTHKWNLKDPRDLDAAYRLAFSGAWTHSSTGALPNGANAYADSFLTPLSALTNNNTHLSYYSRTNTNGTFADMGVSGVGPAYTPLLAMYIRDTDNMATRMYGYDTGENFQSANTNSQGLFIGNRTSSTVLNQWKNSTKLGTATYTNGRNITTLNSKTYIGAINLGGTASQYTNRESAFASIGDGLSDTEAANLYTAVQKYQTSLSRQV